MKLLRHKSIRWTTTEPAIRWSGQAESRYEDHLRLPVSQFLQSQFKGFKSTGLVVELLLLALFWLLIGILSGHWTLAAILSVPASLAVSAFPWVSQFLRRRKALQNRLTYTIRISARGVRIDNGVYLFNRMTAISVAADRLLVQWGSMTFCIGIPSNIPAASITKFLPESLQPRA